MCTTLCAKQAGIASVHATGLNSMISKLPRGEVVCFLGISKHTSTIPNYSCNRWNLLLYLVRVQLPNGGLRGTREPSHGTFAFLELRRIPGEPSKGPPGGSFEGSRERCSFKPRNASAPAAALPRLPSALKAPASCVFHRLQLRASLHTFSAHQTGRREPAVNRAAAGHDDGRYSS